MLGKRIKQLREQNQMSQQDLCGILSIEQSTLANYESGRRFPKLDMLIKIAQYFETSTDYLLGLSDAKDNPIPTDSNLAFLPERLRNLIADNEDISLYASICKIKQSELVEYMSGKEMPDSYTLCKLVDALDTSADYLFGKSDIPHPNNSNDSYYVSGFPMQLRHEMDGNFLEVELAEKLDISISEVKALLSGELVPSPPLLYQMAQLFRKSTDYLLGMTEHSRKQDIDGNYPFIFDKHVAERISKLMDSHGNDAYWADFLSITEEEVALLKNYGFVVHVSVLNRLADMLNVSTDYLAGRTDTQKTLKKSEEALLLAYRNLNEENQSIAYGEVLKLKKDQEREEFMRSANSVAAEEVNRGTGTDGLGK